MVLVALLRATGCVRPCFRRFCALDADADGTSEGGRVNKSRSETLAALMQLAVMC
jgi:hypothetical protein